MVTETTYTNAREKLATYCDQAASTREPVLIRRRHADDVVLIAADEFAGVMETAHLLRSPKNAIRLLTALTRAQTQESQPASVEDLRRELGIG